MPDDAEGLVMIKSFQGWIFGEFGVGIGVFEDFDFGFDAVVGEFVFEMGGRGQDEVGEIGVVNHESPHFGFGEVVGEIVVARDGGFMG